MSTNTDVVTPSSDSERLFGRVKWFNNKAGYGFITVTDGNKSGSDIFVHHSAIEVENQQYKYLIQGEYVEFSLNKTNSSDYEWQATNINGIKGGKLMCETRHDLKLARNVYKNDNEPGQIETKMPRQQKAPRDTRTRAEPIDTRAPRLRGEGPRNGEKKEWTLISKKSEDKAKFNTLTR